MFYKKFSGSYRKTFQKHQTYYTSSSPIQPNIYKNSQYIHQPQPHSLKINHVQIINNNQEKRMGRNRRRRNESQYHGRQDLKTRMEKQTRKNQASPLYVEKKSREMDNDLINVKNANRQERNIVKKQQILQDKPEKYRQTSFDNRSIGERKESYQCQRFETLREQQHSEYDYERKEYQDRKFRQYRNLYSADSHKNGGREQRQNLRNQDEYYDQTDQMEVPSNQWEGSRNRSSQRKQKEYRVAKFYVDQNTQSRLLYRQIKIIHKLVASCKGRASISLKLMFDDRMEQQIFREFSDRDLDIVNLKFAENKDKENEDEDRISTENVSPAIFSSKGLKAKGQFQAQYSFSDQNNGLSASDHMLIIYWLKYFQLKKITSSYQSQLTIVGQNTSFEFFSLCNNRDHLIECLNSAKHFLDSNLILTHHCSDYQELFSKIHILSRQRLKLQQMFRGKFDGKFHCPRDIDLKLFRKTKDNSIIIQASQFSSKLFFFIVLDGVHYDFDQSQEEFDTFIKDNVRSRGKNFIYSLNHSINMDNKMKELQSITRFYQNISISLEQPYFDEQDGLWKLTIRSTQWMQKEQQIDDEYLNKVLAEVKDLLKGQINIKLKTQQQMTLWEKILCNLFVEKCNAAKIDMISTKSEFKNNQQGIIIKLASKNENEQLLNQMKRDIIDSFDWFYFSNFIIRIPDSDLEHILAKSRITKIFGRRLKSIQNQFENLVLLETRPTENFSLTFTAYQKKTIKKESIIRALEDILINKLGKITENIELQQFLTFQNFRTHIEMEDQLEIVIKNNPEIGRVTFVGLCENLTTLKQTIDAFNAKQLDQLNQHIYTFENEYILQNVLRYQNSLQLLVPPQVVDKQIIIKGQKKHLTDAVQKINKFVEYIKSKMYSSTLLMTKIESQYLQSHYSQELLSICSEYKLLKEGPKFIKPLQQASLLAEQLRQLPNVSTQVRSAIYQWSWKDSTQFQNYPCDVNDQLNNAFHLYLSDPRQNTIIITFPSCHQPPTQEVEMRTMTILDLKSKKISKFKIEGDILKINDQVQSDEVYDHIRYQGFMLRQPRFGIFLNKYRIQFETNQITQTNLETGHQRKVQRILLQDFDDAQSVLPIDSIFVNDQEQAEYVFKHQSQDNLNQFLRKLNNLRESIKISKQVTLPHLENDDKFNNLIKSIKEKSINIKGQLLPGRKVVINTIQEYMNQIENIIQIIPNVEFPVSWVPQTNNLKRIQLNETGQEFKQISKLFYETHPKGKISAIYRVQNKHLYSNYWKEKKDLIKRNKDRQLTLDTDEIEQLLWHGVKAQHPKCIYESTKEAFDGTYAQRGAWGEAVYFSSRADYSVNYSYQLKPHESAQCSGHQVFLCCMVSLGKIFESPNDRDLKRPPNMPGRLTAYDSVSGISRGTKVYALYQMDIRRAYPAYEVIFT